MTDKIFITANDLLDDAFRLGHLVLADGFAPDFIVGLWRGGAPVGIAVQELLAYNGVDSDHIAVRTSSYTGIDDQADEIKVHGLHYILDNATAGDSLLIVDDTFDSGRSLDAVIRAIQDQAGANAPGVIKTAVVYYKPTRRVVEMTPDYFVHETDKWLVFPHELQGLSAPEVRAHKPAALKGG